MQVLAVAHMLISLNPNPNKHIIYLPFPVLSLVSSWINGAATDMREEQPQRPDGGN